PSLRIFAAKIGFSDPIKAEALSACVAKRCNPNRDLLPSAPILKQLVETTSDAAQIQQSIADLDRLDAQALVYEQVKSIEEVEYEGWVYDFTVEGTNNFVAEGVLCHNTRVLTHRIAYLIDTLGVDPYNILAVTFTNKAAREMKERLDALLGAGRAAALTVGTFHSICARFLRRDIVHLGRERDFAIYDSDDQLRLMRRALKDLNLDEMKNPPRAIHAEISRAKNELVDAEEFARLG